MKKNSVAICLILFLSTLKINPAFSQTTKEFVVLVKYKTLSDQESTALYEIKKLIEQVKKEPNYINITILVDPLDSKNILLYEKWGSEEYYKGEHMKTPHLLEFRNSAITFLGGPPEISFWKITK